MSDAPQAPRRTEAETRSTWWPGWIWAVPLAAILVAGWLGVRAIAHRGETVTVSFQDAAGVKAGDTKVNYRGLEVGEVAGVALSRDGGHTEIRLKLDRDVKPFLRTGTRFWLTGKISLTDLSSIKAALSGPDVDMEPGPGAPTDRFTGLEQPPAVTQPTPGRSFVLTADRRGSLQQGSAIYYDGEEVGKITSAWLAGPHSFRFDAFVRAPYDSYVSAATRFWNASAVQISAGGKGVQAQLVSPGALLAGGVAFDTTSDATDARRASVGQIFPLYDDEDEAKDAPTGTEVPYLIRFDGAVGDLKPGAAVELRGFRVGQVTGARLSYDPRTSVLATPVTIELEPARFDIRGVPPDVGGRGAVDAMMRRLVAQGLRASLAQDPPLVGGREVELDFVPGAGHAALTTSNQDGVLVIPSSGGADIADIERKADRVMSKIDGVPIDQIGANVRQITGRVRTLVASPRLDDIIAHVDDTSAEVDRTVRQVAPQVGPLVVRLRQTAQEADSTVSAANRLIGGDPESQDSDLPSALHQLSAAARSIRELADYLDRHPEALIKGKAKPKDAP